MIELRFNEKTEYEGVVCLGYFDCVHKGHVELIKRAKKSGNSVFVFTFSTDISKLLGSKEGFIYSYAERLERLLEEGVFGVVSAEFSREFMHNSKSEFLSKLDNTLNIKGLVCGEDYTYGFKGEGTPTYFAEFFNNPEILVIEHPKVLFEGEKASTTLAKKFLKEGNIEKLNALLASDYRLNFRKEGSAYIFDDLEDRIVLPKGVFEGYVMVGGEKIAVEISFDGIRYVIDEGTGLEDDLLKVYFERMKRKANDAV